MRGGGAKRGFLTEQFPRSPGIYIIRSRGRVLYVGQSYNMRLRWAGHTWRKFIEINFPDATVETIPCNKDDLLDVEDKFIKELDPMLNGNNEERVIRFFGLDPNWREQIAASGEYKKWATERWKLFKYARK